MSAVEDNNLYDFGEAPTYRTGLLRRLIANLKNDQVSVFFSFEHLPRDGIFDLMDPQTAVGAWD